VSTRAAVLLTLVIALALPDRDRREDHAVRGRPAARQHLATGARRQRQITARQTALLQEMFRDCPTTNRCHPRSSPELRSLVAKNRVQLAAGEKRIVQIKPGTANGRELKRLVLRFIREVARPLNTCIGKLLVADTPEKLDAVVQCVDSGSRARVALSRAIDKSLAKMRTTRSPCAKG
jgi:hypothetical protein